jgi:hypothetical protein
MTRLLVLAALLALALSGCARGPSEVAAPPVAATASTAHGQALMTATQVAERLSAAGAPLKVTKVYTAADDPKHLLGRPNGYTSKASFADPRVKKSDRRDNDPLSNERGGTIEVFADPAAAQQRSEFIQSSIKQMNGFLTSEYHYRRGGVLVRVSGLLSPDQAQVYGRALTNLGR